MTAHNLNQESLDLHRQHQGKLEVVPKVGVSSSHDLSIAYTPGVAAVSKLLSEEPDAAYDYSIKGNTVLVVTDGSAVLGLGNIGPLGGLPVMEGKCALFKAFAGVNAFPICLDTQDTEEIIETIERIAPVFGGVNLEDIGAPRCFEIEERLKASLDIPVFHDDQHGTAIVVLAATLNALKVVGKNLADVKIVMSGAGAAGCAIAQLLFDAGATDIVMANSRGIIHPKTNPPKTRPELFAMTNKEGLQGELANAMNGADVFIGVSGPNLVTKDMVRSMDKPIVLAMANPDPEIMPQDALDAGAYVVGTGRSDFPNQVNNVLVFPGIFKGALRIRAKSITTKMKLACAYAIANMVEEPVAAHILPDAFDPAVAEAVAIAVEEMCSDEDK
ncbi:NADP-dependent malic enzyme [Peptoniphilus equinus]|uniref:NADP-dependent malic enzyme n=1 Tax=Peptoniphilus equinus TaxID=3016343 RepID=A0ABY7QUN1_9FIRM|nr:NADP-dependent malic enzyme [Peptoniphilus equinus]WBW50497.1 NADP-dependent malic enzyme [Peptoniphilus equinus]